MLTIAQYDNDVQLFFDAIKFSKLHIDQKDPTAYTEDAFIRDIFLQLKQDSLPAEFRLEFGRQETRCMMNKAKITSASLMDDATAYFVNLKNMGTWKMEISRNTQIIALTTQISELETIVSKLSHVKAPTGPSTTPLGTPGSAGTGNYSFELWRHEKVDSKAEHSMLERDGKSWYWCNQHTCNNKGVVIQGMYVSLSKSLQAALVTTAGLSADQFQKIWSDACNELGN